MNPYLNSIQRMIDNLQKQGSIDHHEFELLSKELESAKQKSESETEMAAKLNNQMAEFSEAILGYREGRFNEVLHRAKELSQSAKVIEMLEEKESIIEAIDNLKTCLENL